MGGMLSRWSTSKAQLPPIEDVKDEDPVLTRTLDFAWVTLATNDSYSLGALVLAHSLRNVNTVHKLAVLITPAVSTLMREQLSTVFDVVKVVDVLDSQDESHLALMRRPELGVTFTKLHCWTLTEFEKCVFLDADTLVMRNCDELFEREELSAAPDVGWPDCFNTGVFVYKPSLETFSNLIKFSMEHGSFDGGDQGLLNQYFDDWATKDINKHLPFVYNLTSVAVYSYIPAFKHYGPDVRIVHFIGPGKPWLQQLNPSTRTVNPAPGSEHLAPLLQKWWDIFCEKVHPSMSTNLECASGMSNDDVEACDNNVPLDTEPAEFNQPFTYCTDENDSRQINLPYHPFDVKSSTGELLNITYLEQRERDILEELNRKREEEQKRNEEEQNHFPAEDQGIKEEEEQLEEVTPLNDDECKEFESKEREEIVMESKEDVETQTESTVSQLISDEPQKEEEKESAPQGEQSSFNCNTFFPDEICVQNYLEKNFHTYQTQGSENKDVNIEATQDDPPLPRFLTIAEDDQRQSLNVCIEEQSPPSPQMTTIQNTLSEDCPSYDKGVDKEVAAKDYQENVCVPEVISQELCVPEVQTTKTLSSEENLEEKLPPPEPVEEISSWKLHANGNVDSNKKFSMPKLKPLLPKQNVSYETVNEAIPKVTQYTEFHMNCDYEDYVPCDKLGFVERHILEEVKINEMDKDMKLKTLSYIFPQGKSNNKENKVELVPPHSFDEMTDYDLSLCQRQKGNQPITVANSKHYSRENSCFLPVLKPLKPSKGNEMGRRSSSNGLRSKDRGTKAKVESRKAREKAKIEIKSNVQTHSVEDVLKRLLNFSKGYQKYFTEFTTEKQKSDIATAPNIIKSGYKESSESPRLQYCKEFEDNVDTPFEKVFRSGVSPLLNGGSYTKLNGEYSAANDLIVTAISPVNGVVHEAKTKEDVVEEVIVPKIVDLKLLEKPVRLTEENGYRIESLDSKKENDLRGKMETGCRKNILSRENEDNKLATAFRENPITQSVIVRDGEGTLEAVPTRSINTARKTKKRKRWSAVQGKEKVQRGMDVTVKTPFASPHSSAKGPVAKPSNVFKLLPEDMSNDATTNTGKGRSVCRHPSKTFSQSVRKKNRGTLTVKVAPSIDDSGANNSGIAGAIAKLSLQPGGLPGTESEAACSAQEDYIRRQNWEMGTMDYMGRDSFSNIWSKICETLDEKVASDHGSENESTKNKTDTPSEKTETDISKLGKDELDDKPEKMIAEKKGTEETLTKTDEKVAGTVSESSPKPDPDLSSKASQALEAFGKLFVSGPVVIKSEGSQDVSKPSDTDQSEPPNDEKEQTGSGEESDRKKSIESDEEGRKKKGVLSKILELVGVEPSETPKSVFYDTEESAAKSHSVGGSVFYVTDDGQVSPGNLKVAEEEPAPLQPSSLSSSLKLKTTPGTEIVPPTPPSTPLTDITDKIPAKDHKFLATDDTIMETPPITDKKLLANLCDEEVVKSEVENIIETAVQYAEEQLNRGSQEGVLAKVEEKVSSLLPKASEALEAFGKLFVSGPVTITSTVQEDVPMPPETAEKVKLAETTADETEKDGAGKEIITEAVSNVPPAEAAQDVISAEGTPGITPKSTDVEKDALAGKTEQTEVHSTKDVDISSKPAQTPQAVAKREESGTVAVPLESVPDSQAKDKEKTAELPKSAEATQEDSQKVPLEKTSETTETPVALPEPVPDTITKSKEVSSEVTPKVEELKSEVSEKPAAQEKALVGTGTSAAPSESVPDASTMPEGEPIKVCTDSQGKAQEICQKLDEAVIETLPKALEKEAGASVKAEDISPKLAPGQPLETAPSSEPTPGEESLKKEQEVPSAIPKVPSEPGEPQKTEPVQSPSLSSKASEALEAFGKVFTSGPVVLKSEVPETPPESTKPEEKVSSPRQEVTSSEALEAFGKVFVSGPVTIKSEVEEADAVHPVFQTKPEDEPIYCNIDELEEIKVTSEEDRRKEKPQSSRLTEQILKAIPPQDRKPFTEASSVSSEVSQLLASIEPQNVSILLDKPMTDEMVTAEGDDSSPVPPVPPRRNRSKGRDAPLPPPKKKGKNEKP